MVIKVGIHRSNINYRNGEGLIAKVFLYIDDAYDLETTVVNQYSSSYLFVR